MKTMRNLFNNKKGFTLVEMVITTLILSILMGITMGMISSSGRMFSSSSELAIDKMVADGVFESLESMAKYATHIEIANSKSECTKSYEQGFYIDKTDDKTNSGKLMYDAKTQAATKYLSEPYSDSFYQKRTIKYIVEPYKYSDNTFSDRHVTITVIVCRDGQQMYRRSNTVKCVNLGLLGEDQSSNLIVSNYNVKENQYINFSCDEQLVLSEVDGYNVSSNSSRVMAEYNDINAVLAATLNEAYVTYPDNESARVAAMNLAANTARNEIKELFGGYVPVSTNYGESSPLRFFNGVKATREEVFYGTLMRYYAVDGQVTSESFQGFNEPENFFAKSTFSAYGGNMVQLVLYAMNDNFGFDSSKNLYSPSQIIDYNIYSVRWNDWFLTTTTSGILWWKKTTVNKIDLTNASNSLGKSVDGKRSFNNSYTVFHPLRNTWYYQPDISTALSSWWNRTWNIDDKPIKYDIGSKSSTTVMMDIDSNTVGDYEEEVWIGIGSLKFKITKINHTSSTLWNALPANQINLTG